MAPPSAREKRRETYVARKEERRALVAQVGALERQLARTKAQIAFGRGENGESGRLKRRNAVQSVREEQQRVVSGAQSLLSAILSQQHSHPLVTPIHLGGDWGRRLETVEAMKSAKLKTAYKYLLERATGIEATSASSHRSEEHYETEDGVFCCSSYEVIPFHGVRSVREVFEVALEFFHSMEISITEQLGNLTLRDDCYDDSIVHPTDEGGVNAIDGKVSHYRLESIEAGLATEMNLIGFPQFFDDITQILGPNDEGVTECGLFTSDCVDSDSIYPYRPSTHLRRDISAAVMLTPTWTTNSHGESELVVLMRRAAFLRIHPAIFPVDKLAVSAIRDGISAWGAIMVKFMRGILYTQSCCTARVQFSA